MSEKTDELKKTWGPTVMAVAKYAVIALLGALATWLGLPTEVKVVEVEKPFVVEKVVEVPVAAVESVEGRWQPGKRLFASVVRRKAVATLMKDGFLICGGDPTPLSKEQATALLDSIDDDTIVAAAQSAKIIGDGKFLDRLTAVIDWLLENKDKIAAIVRWLLALLAFAE